MSGTRLILILVFSALTNLGVGQTISSSCIAHDSVVEKYKDDADRLTVRQYNNTPYIDSIIIPKTSSDTILRALIAVYNLTALPERDTVVKIYNIHKRYPDINSFTIRADSNLSWMQNLKNNIIPTGNPTIDSLSTLYHLNPSNYTVYSCCFEPDVTFISDSNYNIKPLADIYKTIPGVIYSNENPIIGDGNDITSKIYSDHVELIYSLGSGDCPSGCTYRRYWKFNCYYDCSVEFAGSYGNVSPLNCYYYSIDTIIACNSFTWIDNNIYTSNNNTATYSLTSKTGCDSTIALNLTINSIDTYVTQNGAILNSNANNATYHWIDCNNGNTAISGETNQTLTTTTNGNFAVEVTQNGCVDTSRCYSIIHTGIWENSFQKLVVYPNPTNGLLTIELGQKYKNVTVIQSTLTGQVVNKVVYSLEQAIPFEIIGSQGMYIVDLITEEGKTAKIKAIKN